MKTGDSRAREQLWAVARSAQAAPQVPFVGSGTCEMIVSVSAEK